MADVATHRLSSPLTIAGGLRHEPERAQGAERVHPVHRMGEYQLFNPSLPTAES